MDKPVALVGRDGTCDVIIGQPTVSRRHLRLDWDGHELALEDLHSAGGTWVNGIRMERSALAPGDILRLGPQLEYVVEGDTPSSALSLATSGRDGDEGVKHLQVLLEVARALNAATVLDEVLEAVLQAAVTLMHADRGCVVLVGADKSRSAVAVHPRDLAQSAWGEQSSLLDRAMAERRTVSTGQGLSPSTSMVLRGATMAVAMPLIVARRPVGPAEDASFIATVEVIGGLVVERSLLGREFSPNDLAVLESLAADAAVAIDGARLYRESREKAKIDHEMALARTIQTAMLRPPPQCAFIDSFAVSYPARVVGGDLYHAALRDDGSFAFALGDVSGKGVAASLVMAMVQGLLSVLHDLGQPVAALPAFLNRTLNRYNPGNRFVTLAVGCIAPDGTLEVVNAGHCPVAVLRAGGEVELIEPHGPILGILPDAAWHSSTLLLAPGDVVVLYSDGITESFSPTGEEFGLEGVSATLRGATERTPDGVAGALLGAAAAFRQGHEADDDVTLLVVGFHEPRVVNPCATPA